MTHLIALWHTTPHKKRQIKSDRVLLFRSRILRPHWVEFATVSHLSRTSLVVVIL